MESCSRAVMSLENYRHFTDDNEIILDEADRAAKETDVRYTHEEVFSRVRRKLCKCACTIDKANH